MTDNAAYRSTRVLFVAPTQKDAEVTCALLKQGGVACDLCETLFDLTREVQCGVGAVLVTEDVVSMKGMEPLVAVLKDQPPWSEIPVVILMHGATQSAAAMEVLGSLGNITLLERPAPMRSVLSAVQSAVRGRQRQYLIRDQIEKIELGNLALRESEGRFRMMANSIPQLAWMAHPDGWIYWYNQRWYDYTGSNPQQMEGWGWQSVHDPVHLPRVLSVWKASIEAGKLFELEFPLRAASGEFRTFLTRGVPVCNESGKILHWFGTNTDVEEQHRARIARQRLLESERTARAEAERVSHMKDEFLATLSHELRTPLSAILGWSQLLSKEPVDPVDLKEGLQTIERNARVQTQLIEDLLDMSRIISGKLRMEVQSLAPQQFVRAAIETVRPAAQVKGIRIEQMIPQDTTLITGDPNRLQQVIWNLLSNAIKFTPAGGAVRVMLENVNSHVEISISDSGQGIAPDFLPHVFERFRQADSSTTRKHGGLGLGLAIVKTLVELHGGSVRAMSGGEGKGSIFTVSLPLAEAILHGTPSLPETHRPKKASPSTDLLIQGVRVLAVDDELDSRVLIKRILEECGCEVFIAGSASDALRVLQEFKPDVIVSDIGMPEVDGYEFLRRVRSISQTRETPAIALTAFARDDDRARALRAGFLAHIAKPLEPSELLATIASVIKGAGMASTS
jgi:PAS domain S-box-containing protein